MDKDPGLRPELETAAYVDDVLNEIEPPADPERAVTEFESVKGDNNAKLDRLQELYKATREEGDPVLTDTAFFGAVEGYVMARASVELAAVKGPQFRGQVEEAANRELAPLVQAFGTREAEVNTETGMGRAAHTAEGHVKVSAMPDEARAILDGDLAEQVKDAVMLGEGNYVKLLRKQIRDRPSSQLEELSQQQ